jgi:hypothetical protein
MTPINGISIYRTGNAFVMAFEKRYSMRVPTEHRVLTIKDLVDLEGQIAYLRMQYELGDKFDAPKAAKPLRGYTSAMYTLDDAGFLPRPSQVTVDEIGNFVDEIACNKRREIRIVVRRALEELVELCLASGCSVAQITNGVADSIHNQCLKASKKYGHTIFPSQLTQEYDFMEIVKELADTYLVLKDFQHAAGIDAAKVACEERNKFEKLKSTPPSGFVTDGHTFYLKKPHVGDNVPST